MNPKTNEKDDAKKIDRTIVNDCDAVRRLGDYSSIRRGGWLAMGEAAHFDAAYAQRRANQHSEPVPGADNSIDA